MLATDDVSHSSSANDIVRQNRSNTVNSQRSAWQKAATHLIVVVRQIASPSDPGCDQTDYPRTGAKVEHLKDRIETVEAAA